MAPILTPLKANCTSADIIEAFKHPSQGLCFISTTQNLPNYTFVTADAVNWLLSHVEGVSNLDKGIQVNYQLEVSLFFFYQVFVDYARTAQGETN